METLFTPQNIKIISNTLTNGKKKERFDTILEPLQCITQLALLSFCPIGTKISIEKNLLHLQVPSYSQGILRWYKNDNKDDLFYLFYACKRFPLYYASLKNIKCKEDNLYDLLIKHAKNGLDKLAKTYSKVDKISILHTLEIYKALLEKPDAVPMFEKDKDERKDIEDIFINIKKIYTKPLLQIIFNTLLLIKDDEKNASLYIDSLNMMLQHNNDTITNWIHTNVLF